MIMKRKLTGRRPGHIYVGGRWLKIGSDTEAEITIPGYDAPYMLKLIDKIYKDNPFPPPREVEDAEVCYRCKGTGRL